MIGLLCPAQGGVLACGLVTPAATAGMSGQQPDGNGPEAQGLDAALGPLPDPTGDLRGADGRGERAGDGSHLPPLLDSSALRWDAEPSELSAIHDPEGCERDPVVTPDMRWLFVSFSRGCSGDYIDRELRIYPWNDGNPGSEYTTLPLVAEGVRFQVNPHILDGEALEAGAELQDAYLLVVQVSLVEGDTSDRKSPMRGVWLRRDAPASVLSPLLELNGWLPKDAKAGDFSASRDGATAVYFLQGRGGTIEVSGRWSGTDPMETSALARLPSNITEAALSPDARTVVFDRGRDLWVARRGAVAEAFDDPVPLSAQNTNDTWESEAFVAEDGTLLFVRDAGAGLRVFRALPSP